MEARRFLTLLFSIGLVVALAGTAAVGLAQGRAVPPPRPASQDPVSTAFTYQGRLMDGGSPANGEYDFQFALFDSNETPVGPVVALNNQEVIDGLFTARLDFGDVFDGKALWLEIRVRPGGSADPHTVLLPRQELTATPYSLRALDLGCTGCIDSTDIENGSILFADFDQNGCSPGQVMKWNGTEWTCSNAYARTVVVSPMGTTSESGTALLSALDNITDASYGKPYLLKIEPGFYALGSQPLIMKEFVDIEGSGELVTTIRASGSPISTTGTLIGADNAEVRLLRVENDGGSDYAIAIFNDSASPRLTHVSAAAWGGSKGNQGVRNLHSSPVMTNVSATASGVAGSGTHGVYNLSSSPEMINVTATAFDGEYAKGVENIDGWPLMMDVTAMASSATEQNTAVYNDDSAPKMVSVIASASGGKTSVGVRNAYCSPIPTMTDVTATASGGSVGNWAVWNQHSSAVMTNVTLTAQGADSCGLLNSGAVTPLLVTVDISRITGGTNSIRVEGQNLTTRVGASRLVGSLVTGGPITCAGVYDDSYTFYASSCP